MDILRTHSAIVQDYEAYIKSFLNIADEAIHAKVEDSLKSGKLWPSPLLQFNPSFDVAGDVALLTQQGVVHPAFADIFRDAKTKQLFRLYRHQVDAIKLGASGKGFVVSGEMKLTTEARRALGKAMVATRHAQNLTQEKLVAMSGVSISSLQRTEHGNGISQEGLDTVASALGTSATRCWRWQRERRAPRRNSASSSLK